jgi:hypothetical protein
VIPRRAGISLVIAFAISGRVNPRADSPKTEPWDCGTFALYHLLKLESRPTDLVRLRSVLPAPGAAGHSLRYLRDAARRFGLPLDAVVLPKRRSAIKGPILMFVKRDREGHFIVVRPVGHTGHLVQVLDGERLPIVIDADRPFASPSWTGLALVPRRTNYLAVAAGWLSAVCMGAYVLRRRRRKPGQSVPHLSSGRAISRSPGKPAHASPSLVEPRP